MVAFFIKKPHFFVFEIIFDGANEYNFVIKCSNCDFTKRYWGMQFQKILNEINQTINHDIIAFKKFNKIFWVFASKHFRNKKSEIYVCKNENFKVLQWFKQWIKIFDFNVRMYCVYSNLWNYDTFNPDQKYGFELFEQK